MNKFDILVDSFGGIEPLVEAINKEKEEGLSIAKVTEKLLEEVREKNVELTISPSLLCKKLLELGYRSIGNKYVLPKKLEAKELTLEDYKFFNETKFSKDVSLKAEPGIFEEFERTIKALYPNQPTYKVINIALKEFVEKHNPNKL